MTNDTKHDTGGPLALRLTEGLGPLVEVRGVLANNVQIPLNVRGVYDLSGGKTGVYVTWPDDWQDTAVEQLQQEVAKLRLRISDAEHWAMHAMLMRSTQNAELLGILRGGPNG